MFSHIYETRYGDYKDFETIKTGSVLDFVQDISIKDSNKQGYGIHVLKDMNLAWLMQGINLKLLKPVRTNFPVEVSTAVKKISGATSVRGCILKQNGEVVAKTVANWFLFNIKTNRVAKVLPEMISAYEIYNFEDDFFIFRKPVNMSEITPSYTIRVSNKDIDTNMHLNNQKSAEILMDALPFDFCYTDMKILYKKPAYLGDELEVCIKETEKGYYVHLQTKEKEVCVIGTFETE